MKMYAFIGLKDHEMKKKMMRNICTKFDRGFMSVT